MHATKKRILEVVLKEGAQRGIDNLSLSDIAKETGITKATIFSHFKNRDDIIETLYRDISKIGNPEQLSFDGSAEEVLQRCITGWIDTFTDRDHCDVWSVVQREKYTDPRAERIANSLTLMIESRMMVLLQTLNDTGRLDIPDLDLAVTLLGSAMILFIDEKNRNRDVDWLIERTITRFCTTFASKP